jgi:hypothetical protein
VASIAGMLQKLTLSGAVHQTDDVTQLRWKLLVGHFLFQSHVISLVFEENWAFLGAEGLLGDIPRGEEPPFRMERVVKETPQDGACSSCFPYP